jgi:membrane-associated phospholipid phosphatase
LLEARRLRDRGGLPMIAATPVIGAHYMLDVIGGIALAAASIWLTGAARPFIDRRCDRAGIAVPAANLGIEAQ